MHKPNMKKDSQSNIISNNHPNKRSSSKVKEASKNCHSPIIYSSKVQNLKN